MALSSPKKMGPFIALQGFSTRTAHQTSSKAPVHYTSRLPLVAASGGYMKAETTCDPSCFRSPTKYMGPLIALQGFLDKDS
jgi:hypothetical protein